MLPFLYAAMVCGGLSYRALVTGLPTVLLGEGATAADLRSGGWITCAVLAVGGVGQLLGGRLSDRVRPTWLYVILIVLGLPPAVALGLGLEGGQAAVAALLAFSVFAVQPVENNILAKASPTRHRATLYGLKFAPAFGIGALATPVVGRIWKATDALTGVFLLIAGLLVVMVSLALTVALRMRAARRRRGEESDS
jgi:MFS family permease